MKLIKWLFAFLLANLTMVVIYLLSLLVKEIILLIGIGYCFMFIFLSIPIVVLTILIYAFFL